MEPSNGPQSLNYKYISFCPWLLWTLNIFRCLKLSLQMDHNQLIIIIFFVLLNTMEAKYLKGRQNAVVHCLVRHCDLCILEFWWSQSDKNHTAATFAAVAAKHAKSTFISHPVLFEQPRSFEWQLFCIPIWARHAYQRPQIFYSLSPSSSLMDYKPHCKITITDHTISSVGVSVRAALQMSFDSFVTNPWSLLALHELTGTYSRSPFVMV